MKALMYASAVLMMISLAIAAFYPCGRKEEPKRDLVTVIRSEALEEIERPPKLFIYKRPRPAKDRTLTAESKDRRL